MRRKIGKMKSKGKSVIIVLITLGIVFALLPTINIYYNFGAVNSDEGDDVINIDYTNLKSSKISGKIFIIGNIGWANAKIAGICTGNGTYSEPYVIEDLEINGTGSGSCILIQNSDVYFRIENCTLYNSGVNWGDAGIRLNNVKNGNLNDNNCSSNFMGMEIENSSSYNISGNSANDNANSGIHIKNCSSMTLLENAANNNVEIGLYIEICRDINITDNDINSNDWVGMFLDNLNSSIIVKNTVNINGHVGIILGNSRNNIVKENTANNNVDTGITLPNCSYSEVVDNTVKFNGWAGIFLYSDSTHNLLLSNNVSDNLDGIFIRTPNNTISDNNIHSNAGAGIALDTDQAVSNNITRNFIKYNHNGITLDDRSSLNIIEGNHIIDNAGTGLKILIHLSTHNLIFNNTFINNLLTNAEDNGNYNNWSNGTLGNYWDDYSGVDANDDGIGDTPYAIFGADGSHDNFPIWDDGPEPVAPESPGIPGYNLFVLLGVLSVVAIIISAKLKKFNK